jgi:lipid A ethanolaminephosphotransferase
MSFKPRSITTPLKNFSFSPLLLILLVSFFITVTSNFSFVEHFSQEYEIDKNVSFLGALLIIIFAFNTLITGMLYLILPLRWSVSIMLILAAVCAYFSDKFGVVIDVEMIRNSLQTNMSEASDLLTLNLFLRLILLAIVPIVLISLLSIKTQKESPWWLIKLKSVAASLGVALLLIVISIALFSAQFSSFIRQHKQLRYYINPIQAIYSGGKYMASQFKSTGPRTYIALTENATVLNSSGNNKLVIMVVGETARADHLSLNGYSRETNSLLSQQQNVVTYSQISSCGTSTAISVPCMFSLSSRDDFEIDSASYTQNTLDIIAMAGVSVLWRDNNSDSKGVATRQLFEDFRTPEHNPECIDECRDTGMLGDLQDYIDKQPKDILIVLHQMGSHGPAYYKRYPKEFEKYTPACQTAELSNCSDQEIINAYDNTIVYTDYFLTKIIELLQANTDKFQTSMLYVSDHGESLGENGIYLHGLPYAFAPDSQTHVPIVLWSDDRSNIDLAQTRELATQANSHDALAKTLISMFEIETDAPLNSAPNLVKFKQAP